MAFGQMRIHQTVTRRIKSSTSPGWDFTCPDCGYHARYWARPKPGAPKLEILNIGDAYARHSSQLPQLTEAEWPERTSDYNYSLEEEPGLMTETEEAWLTPELRAQIERILKDFS